MKLTNNLTIESRMRTYMNRGFSPMQLEIIQDGLESDIDVSKYAFVQYNEVLMICLLELLTCDKSFDLDNFVLNNKLEVLRLLDRHDSIAHSNQLTRFGTASIDHILRDAPYYTSY